MTIEEFIKIINNKSMYSKQTNIRLIESKKGSKSKKSKKLTTRDLVLQLIKRVDKFEAYVLGVFKRNNLN